MANYWLILFAISSEASGIAGLLSDAPLLLALTGYLVAHSLACGALTLVLLVLLPARYKSAPVRAGMFLFSLQFAIPFLGSIGVFMGVLLALYLPRSEQITPWQEINIPELPYRPMNLDHSMIYSEGGLRQVLRDAGDPDKRLRALLATRQMPGRDSVDILKEALKDPVDDVRLLAYSMLEQQEKKLAAEAGDLKQALENPADQQTQMWQRRLAQVWWETAYLGLAQGSLRRYYLKNAQSLLVELVGKFDRHTDWRLLGRVELELGNRHAAHEAFELALDNGATPDMILPYLAEIAFLDRDYQRVRYYLARCSRHRNHPALNNILEAWL